MSNEKDKTAKGGGKWMISPEEYRALDERIKRQNYIQIHKNPLSVYIQGPIRLTEEPKKSKVRGTIPGYFYSVHISDHKDHGPIMSQSTWYYSDYATARNVAEDIHRDRAGIPIADLTDPGSR